MITPILLKILFTLLRVYYSIMIISIILTWIPSLRQYKFFRTIDHIGSGYLKHFRGKIVISFLDFTPMIGLILYWFMLDSLALLI